MEEPTTPRGDTWNALAPMRTMIKELWQVCNKPPVYNIDLNTEQGKARLEVHFAKGIAAIYTQANHLGLDTEAIEELTEQYGGN